MSQQNSKSKSVDVKGDKNDRRKPLSSVRGEGRARRSVGVPKEVKNHEYRVGLTPDAVGELTAKGHEVRVEKQAGHGIGFEDAEYRQAGAQIVSRERAFAADLVVKVKEPQLDECALLRPGQMLFTYLHLAADRPQAEALMRSGATAIAYETVTDEDGRLPLLAPMSEVAGRMSVQVGAACLQRDHGGRGTLLGGVPGVASGRVVVIGGGVAGSHAAEMAVGLQAQVTIIEKSPERIRELARQFGGRVEVLHANAATAAAATRAADLVIGAVLVPGDAAPKVISREMVRAMPNGSAIVDIAIDQGGCMETSRPTTHDAPTFMDEGVVHYCVTNMPGAVARTSTMALNNVTLPYVMALAEHGWREAMARDAGLAAGLNVHDGAVTHASVARALGLPEAA